MSILNNLLGLGDMARGVGNAVRENTEVFKANATEEMHRDAENFQASLDQYEAEFQHEAKSLYSQLIDGFNRLPRPLMALGTIGLFAFALYDPERFSVRMIGLQEVPEELWWLMGAIVSFYFGARELHYIRRAKTKALPQKLAKAKTAKKQKLSHAQAAQILQPSAPASKDEPIAVNPAPATFHPPQSSDNPAIQDWLDTSN